MQNDVAAVNDKPKVSLPPKLILLSECQLQQVKKTIIMQKTVKDRVTTSGIIKKWHHQYKNSAKERADIRKYSSEVLQLPYHIR